MKKLEVRIDDGVYLDLTEFYQFSLKNLIVWLRLRQKKSMKQR